MARSHEVQDLQWLFSPEDMQHTPSVVVSGMTPEMERYHRWKGVHFLCRIGEYCRLGNHVITTAAYFFHRFFMRRPMPRDGIKTLDTWVQQEMAPTCVWLACKVEESCRKLHMLVEATMAVNDRTPEGMAAAEQHAYRADVHGKEYSRWSDLVLLNEERLLETLCFDVIVEQPHAVAIRAMKLLRVDVDLARLTVVLLNSFLYGAVCTFYEAPILAACAFQKACDAVELDPASFAAAVASASNSQEGGSSSSSSGGDADRAVHGRTWLDAFDVDQDEIEEAMPAIEDFLMYHEERLYPPPGPGAAPVGIMAARRLQVAASGTEKRTPGADQNAASNLPASSSASAITSTPAGLRPAAQGNGSAHAAATLSTKNLPTSSGATTPAFQPPSSTPMLASPMLGPAAPSNGAATAMGGGTTVAPPPGLPPPPPSGTPPPLPTPPPGPPSGSASTLGGRPAAPGETAGQGRTLRASAKKRPHEDDEAAVGSEVRDAQASAGRVEKKQRGQDAGEADGAARQAVSTATTTTTMSGTAASEEGVEGAGAAAVPAPAPPASAESSPEPGEV